MAPHRGFRPFVLLLALAGCAGLQRSPPPPPTLDGFPLERFYRVDGDLYRSAQPDGDQFRKLQERYGIKSVVKLNSPGQPDRLPPGVTLIAEPLNAVVTPEPATIERILDEIERAPKPVLIHCSLGRDRTGLIVALYRRRHGASVDDAYADMVQRGFRPFRGLWNAWIRTAATAER